MPRFQTTDFMLSRIGNQFKDMGSIRLMFKQTTLADQTFRQFWIPKPGLFGIRNQRSGNHAAVLDFYQTLCFDRVNDQDENPAKTHLLASLLPSVRNNKAQGIFPDACVTPPKGCSVTQSFDSNELELLLQGSKDERTSVVDFCNSNRKAVEFPEYPESTFELYRDFESELFADAARWWSDPVAATKRTMERWSKWHKDIGRRGGNNSKKEVLNILSFESKAAFQQCYSALWVELIPHLIEGQENQLFSQRFHTLWHLDHRFRSSGQRDAHLFHGLVFALHPVFGKLLTTEEGSRLVGKTVANPDDVASQERFLHAGLVSLHLYVAARSLR